MFRFRFMVILLFAMILLTGIWAGLRAEPRTPATPPVGPFGLSRVATEDGKPLDIDSLVSSETCGVCHERDWKEFQGSMHSAAHTEPFYRGFALLARKEAGDKVYAYCSGCHSAAAVVSGLIPKKPDRNLPAEAKAGVSCDVCHQISRLTGSDGPWGEPGNASFNLTESQVKYANSGLFQKNRAIPASAAISLPRLNTVPVAIRLFIPSTACALRIRTVSGKPAFTPRRAFSARIATCATSKKCRR